jgi:hypothetical protein
LKSIVDDIIQKLCILWVRFRNLILRSDVPVHAAAEMPHWQMDIQDVIETLEGFAVHKRLARLVNLAKDRLDVSETLAWDEADMEESAIDVGRVPYVTKAALRRAVMEAALEEVGICGLGDAGVFRD